MKDDILNTTLEKRGDYKTKQASLVKETKELLLKTGDRKLIRVCHALDECAKHWSLNTFYTVQNTNRQD
ncbi:MAG: hypothetical protein R3F02_06325 [Thiolinea sp.]